MWSSSVTYGVNAYCIYNNSMWKCKVQHSNQTPTEGTYWTKVSIGNELKSINGTLTNKPDIITYTATYSFEFHKVTINFEKIGHICIAKVSHYVSGGSWESSANGKYVDQRFRPIATTVSEWGLSSGYIYIEPSGNIGAAGTDNTNFSITSGSTYVGYIVYYTAA